MKNIQDIIDAGGSNIELPAGEFKGPVIIRKPCTVKGNSTTLWNNDGKVIEIRSSGVKICNLRAEITDHNSELYCINSYYPDTLFENVEIAGNVKGIKDEELQWIIPRSISMGEFKSDSVNTYTMEIYIPSDAVISSDISGIKLSPVNLKKGKNIINIETEEIRNNVFIYGEIFIKSKFIRRIYVSGKSFSNASLKQNVNLFKAENPNPEKNIETNFDNISMKSESIHVQPVQNTEENKGITRLRKGERFYIDDMADDLIQIEFNCRQLMSPMDIDPYVFLLNKNNIVPTDNDFIFFSNPVSKNREVKIQSSDKSRFNMIEIDLKRVPDNIEKISVAYSIYVNSSRDNFSKVNDPFITLRSKGNIKYLFPAENLIMETTVIFLEIYRHNMSWKMNMVGAGYKNGLSMLCESYGLKVGY